MNNTPSKGRATPRRRALKHTTISSAVEIVFNEMLDQALQSHDWTAVERAFNWLGSYMEAKEAMP